jgi:hypothetical protein
VVCLPVVAALIVVGTIIVVGLQHLVARALGGQGVFDDMIYSYASFSAPISLITSAMGMIPLVGCLSLFVVFYALALNVIAVKAVHRLDTGRAILSVFWWIPLGCLCLILFGVIIALASS